MRMESCFAVLVLAFAILYGVFVRGEDRPPAGPPWSKALQVKIVGSTAFTAEDIKSQLDQNFMVSEASREATTPEEYASYLGKKVVDGYRHAGFAEAKASISVDRKRHEIEIQVQEGKQFKCGEIRLTGCKRIPVGKVVQALTEPSGPSVAISQSAVQLEGKQVVKWFDRDGREVLPDEPVWPLGKTAKMEWTCSGKGAVTRAFENLGFYNVDYDLQYVPDAKRGVVCLAINVSEEGVCAQIGQVRLASVCTKSSWDHVVRYLSLRPGMPLTGLDCRHLEDQLWQSGRFSSCSVQAHREYDSPRNLAICVEIAGYEKIPPLGEALSPAEQVMLAARRWLIHPEQWNADLVFSMRRQASTVEAVVSPRLGILMWNGQTSEEGRVSIQHAAAIMRREVLGYSAVSNRRLSGPIPGDYQSAVMLGISLGNEADRRLGFKFGVAIEPPERQAGNACQLRVSVAPAAAIALLYEHGARYQLDKGILSVSTEDARWRIEAATGRLIECGSPSGSDNVWRIAFQAGAFEDRRALVRKASDKAKNCYDAASPDKSIVQFFVHDVAKEPQLSNEQRECFVKAAEFIALLERFCKKKQVSSNARDTGFDIPSGTFQWRDDL